MPTQSNDDAWKRSFEYSYYPPTRSLAPASAASTTAMTAETYATTASHHPHAYAHMYHHAYTTHTPQYYAAPLPLPVASYPMGDMRTSEAYAVAPVTTATTTTTTTTPLATSYTDMLTLPIVDTDIDDVRMLQEMLLTPIPTRHDEARETHATLLFQSPYSRPHLTPSAAETTTPHSETSGNESHATPTGTTRLARSRSRTQRKIPSARICRVPDCNKGIRSRGLCKAHGGGRRCQTPGCTISDQGGGHCIAHGGGKRCTVSGCEKSAQFKGLCKVHGGSRRCRVADCDKNGQIKGLCRQHYTQSVQEHGPDDF